MHLDIVCSLVIYTMATVAFYLLGAGVLHRLGLVPAERDTITVLSNIYTQTLGGWALWLFYARRRRHALWHHLRVNRGARTPFRRRHARRWRATRAKMRAARIRWRNRFVDHPVGDASDSLLVPALAGADGRRRRNRAGADAAAHRRRQ